MLPPDWLAGGPARWRQLAREGHYDDVAALLPDEAQRDHPLVDAVVGTLAWGALHPRAEHLATDVARAVAIVERFGSDREWHGWTLIRLAFPVLHPHAVESWAVALGVPARTLRALRGGEVYVELDGSLALWPWYPEQDDALRSAAEARASDLGVAMPPRFLDEPYEAAFYLERTGEPAVLARVAAAGIDPDAARVRALPLPPGRLRTATRRGGVRVPDPLDVGFGRIRGCNFEPDGHWPAAMIEHQRARLNEAVAALFGRGTPQRALDEAPESAFEGTQDATGHGTAVTGLRATPTGALLQIGDALVVVEGDRPVRRFEGVPGHLRVVVGHLAVVEHWGSPRVVDLRTGRLRTETWRALLAELDAPDAVVPDTRFLPSDEEGRLDATGHHLWVDDVIVRVADGWPVVRAEDLLRAHDEDDDDDRGPGTLPVLDPGDPEGDRVLHVEGVRFTIRRRHGVTVTADEEAPFVQGPDGWRTVVDGTFRVNGRAVARFGRPIALAALAPDGGEAWLVEGDRVHVVRWERTPVLDRSLALAALVAS